MKSIIETNQPLVSVLCFAYNHENYIKDTLDGFLFQETDFRFEVIIHDDASTDKTSEIIRDYCTKYPNLFRPIFQNENQHSKERGRVSKITYNAARGKYIALCEGDDYWIDPYKLHKQVNFLEQNESFSFCCGAYKTLSRNSTNITARNRIITKNKILKLENSFDNGDIKTLTILFRQDDYHKFKDKLYSYKYVRDSHLFFHLFEYGNGYLFKDVFGVYRIHDGGVHSSSSYVNLLLVSYNVFKELYQTNINNEFLLDRYIRSILALISYQIYNFDNSFNINSKLNELLIVKSKVKIWYIIKLIVYYLIPYQFRMFIFKLINNLISRISKLKV